MSKVERYDTVIVGGGQAGLATAYHLARAGRSFAILDALDRVGDAWRNRWNSLRLFTPAKYDGLPGWEFPAAQNPFPTKDEMAGYLEAYVERFELPVQNGVRVDRLSREDDGFVLAADGRRFEADRVVIATGAYRRPRTPALARELDPRIVQLHSSEYRGPEQLAEGAVLVVGAGNSGAEIAFEVARSHPTLLSGRDVGEIPVRHGSKRARVVLPLMRFVGHRVMTVRTPIGRKVGPKLAYGATPLIRIKTAELVEAGVERVGKVAGVENGLPVLEDGRVVDVPNVVWSTGFTQDFAWIDLPVFGEDGRPLHRRGVVESEPGLYFVGLPFQYSVTSDVLPGVGRDARFVARHIVRQPASSSTVSRPAAPALRRVA
jgi:putative flavoprotein involved in K+ transport